jgi:hypothetical protein
LIRKGEASFGKARSRLMAVIVWWLGKGCSDLLNMVALGSITWNSLAAL